LREDRKWFDAALLNDALKAWFGLNIYSANYARAGKDGKAERIPFPKAYPRSDVGWQTIVPDAVYWAVRFTQESCAEIYMFQH
jgi:hypothetical protein